MESSAQAPAEAGETLAAQRKRRKQKRHQAILGAIAGVVVLGIAAIFFSSGANSHAPGKDSVTNTKAQSSPASPVGPYPREKLEGNLALVDEFLPTHGQPIGMRYVPNGVNFVVHLRPAELWGDDRAAKELRASLTEDVVTWLEAAIKSQTHREPSQISEATFVFVMGAFGTVPRPAVVVHLKEPTELSVLKEEFSGRLLNETQKPAITVGDTLAHVLVDSSTYAIAPADTAVELQDSLSQPNGYVSRNLVELLKQTDRDRLITIAGEIPDLRRHIETLIPEAARRSVSAILDWLGEDVVAFTWSLHARPALHSRLVLKPKAGISPNQLRASLQKKLDDLPQSMTELVKSTKPQQAGFRTIIGRFPAMLEAVRQSTILHVGPQQVQVTTVLPAKAAPNLALGTLLTWDELRRTSASAPATTVAQTPATTESIAERLNKPVLIEFNRTPLEQVVTYIGEQVGVNFTVDGEALEATGYTRNMPQTLSLGTVSAKEALKAMVSIENQSELAVHIDEAAQTAVMSTKPYLKQKNRTPFPLD